MRHFELCGTDRLLERLKDDMLYSDDGVTAEKVQAAIDAHPLLRDDLCEFLKDYLLTQMPTDEEIEAEAANVTDADAQRFGDRIKHMLRGIDIARNRDAMKAAGA